MTLLADIAADARYAVRSLRREPTFCAGVILTFALAIGANAAMFGLVERLMLAAPPGIHDAARVVRLELGFAVDDGQTYRMSTTSYPTFRLVATQTAAFNDVAAVSPDTMTLGQGADLTEVSVVRATGRYFAVLGVQPARGRFFGPADDAVPDGNPVVVLGHAYWQRRFAGDANVLGTQLVIDDVGYTVIGVAPRDFNGDALAPVDLYIPLSAAMRARGAGWWSERHTNVVAVLARLREGVSARVAESMVTTALRSDPEAYSGERLATVSFQSLLPGKSARSTEQGRIALWLSGVSLVVLLIATANVGTLLLLRAARRRRELAVRVALGAGRARLARQSVVESVLLAVIGGVIGLVLARWFADVVRVTLLPNLAPTDRVVDSTVLSVSILASVGAGIIAGLSPLAHLGTRKLAAELRSGSGHGASGRFLFQNALVALQVALSALLVVGSGLFVRSLQRVQSQDLGFSTSRLLHVTLDIHGTLPALERDAIHERAAQHVATLPGVTGATLVEGMPFSSHHIPPISVPGVPNLAQTGRQLPIMYAATPAYLDMMGVVLRDGRRFTAQDERAAPLVVLVNETMARTLWPGQSALGKCVRAGYPAQFDPDNDDPMSMAEHAPCRTVVGVVKDSRARSLRLEGSEDKLMQYYVPFAQIPAPPFPNFARAHGILVRTAKDPAELASAVQRAIQSTSTVGVYAHVRPYQELIDPQLRSWRLGATLFTVFGLLALGIASVGLFGVISYLVAQRTQEIGVRLALGGSGGAVARLVVRDAARMAAIGVAAGLILAIVCAPLVQSMLFQTSARNPATMLAAAVVLLVVAVAAAAIPAWRASRVSPMTALRADL